VQRDKGGCELVHKGEKYEPEQEQQEIESHCVAKSSLE